MKWSQFSSAASGAAGDIRGIDSGDFIGDEADTYRDKLNKDLPPHLDTTSQAWTMVSSALQTYATTLEGLQQRMSGLQAQAVEQQGKVDAANDAVANAKTADAQHHTTVAAAEAKLKPGQTLPPDSYQAQTSGASTQQANATAALQSTIDAANKVHAEHDTAVDTCVRAINHAAGMRFEEPPGFWDKLTGAVGGWIKDHVDVLKSISSVLKTISGIAGLLAMIPVLAPVMGPIALAAGGTALLIDVTVKVTTGEGSWGGILLDGATMLPMGKAFALVKDTKVVSSVAKVADRAGSALADSKAARSAQYAVAAVKNRAGHELDAFAAGMKNAVTPRLAMAGGPEVGGLGMNFSMAAYREGSQASRSAIKNVYIDSAKYPETAEHVLDAQSGKVWAGDALRDGGTAKPSVVTIDRAGADARRKAWQQSQPDVPTKPGFDRDEYPPAMFSEGGPDASLKYISPSDNRGAGSSMGWQTRVGTAGLPKGTQVRIVVR